MIQKNHSRLEDLLEELVHTFKQELYPELREVYLYGSCARGDCREDSDVNLLVIMEVEPEETPHFDRQVTKITHRLSAVYGIPVSPVTVSRKEYTVNLDYTPLFGVVQSQGIRLVQEL